MFRPLTGRELADLEASVGESGFLYPALAATLPGFGLSIIDGGHRARIALDRGLFLPVDNVGYLSLEDAEAKACTANLHRRQLTQDEITHYRAEQAVRMKAMRDRGLSLRTIAKAEGLRHTSQVMRAIAKVGGDADAPPAKKLPPTVASLAASAARALDVAFQKLHLILKADRDQLVSLAERFDCPFQDDRPGRENWPTLTAVSQLRGLLAHVS
jgi:ParB-like chromosome segregation protein Spo0J